MKVLCINNYDDICKLHCSWAVKYENAILYRGTSNSLVPSLVEKCSYKTYEDLAYKEFMLLSDFSSYTSIEYQYNNDIPLDWEQRIAAREYGLVSSLIDWTNDIKIATEFSIHHFQKKDIPFTSIWMLIKDKINQIEINNDTAKSFSEIDEPTILNYNLGPHYYQNSYSKRKFVQGGFFVKQSYSDICLPINLNSFFKENLIQIIIPRSAIFKIRNSLSSILDLNETAMPSRMKKGDEGLDELCEYLNNKYI